MSQFQGGSSCLVPTGESSEGPPRLIKRGEALGQVAEAAQLPGHLGGASAADSTARR